MLGAIDSLSTLASVITGLFFANKTTSQQSACANTQFKKNKMRCHAPSIITINTSVMTRWLPIRFIVLVLLGVLSFIVLKNTIFGKLRPTHPPLPSPSATQLAHTISV